MRTWIAILSLCCLALAAQTASASVVFSGLSHSPLGACLADVNGDGMLDLRNIGSSGQDGVSVACAHLDGLQMSLSGTCSDGDAGAVCVMSYQWTLISQPSSSLHTSISMSVSAGHVDFTPDLAGLGKSPVERIDLHLSDGTTSSLTVPAGTPVSVSTAATGSCPNPTLSCSVDRAALRVAVSGAWPSPQRCSVGGTDVDCDGFDISCALDGTDTDCDGVSASLRVLSPPGSSFGEVRCSTEDCRVHSNAIRMLGLAQVSAPPPSSSGVRRIRVSNLGSSGQDGVSVSSRPWGGGGGGGGAGGLSGLTRLTFASPSLTFDPSTDNGASCVTRIVGSSSVVSHGTLGSMALTIVGNDFRVMSDFSGLGAVPESVEVLAQGVEVARAAMPRDGIVHVQAPPGGPLGMAINEKGLPGDRPKQKTKSTKAPDGPARDAAGRPEPLSSADVASGSLVPLDVGFRNSRIFIFGGLQVTGDELVCWGDNSAAAGSGVALSVDRQECVVSCPSPSSSLQEMDLLDVSGTVGDLVSAEVAPSTCLSTAHTCVSVPVVFSRSDATPVRAFSVSFHLTPELTLCGGGVTEGDYLNRIAGTQMFVTNKGGGAYTVDCSILGPVCGATGDGTLFTLQLGAASPPVDGTAAVFVDDVQVRDCSNASVPGSPGATGYLPVDFTAPGAITALTAAQVRSGNDRSGTTQVALAWPAVESDAAVAVYRKGFGNYPEYDDPPGAGSPPSPPATPAAALAAGWTLTGVSASGGADQPASRDYYYYCAFVTDGCDNVSAVSNTTPGTLDYHLGDVSDGTTACQGDNSVDAADISLLGSHYGASVASGSPFACLDVGPTSDRSTSGRPVTDDVVNFEDFMMFAINYSAVSSPQAARTAVPAAANAARLASGASPAVGQTFDVGVQADGAGDAQAMSIHLAYDHSILEQVGVAPGSLLGEQGRPSAVLSSGPGDVDVALLGKGAGIAGQGEIARITFRVKAPGDPQLAVAGVEGRDAGNQPVIVTLSGAPGGAATPTALGFAYPNPFSHTTDVRLSLREAGAVSLVAFDIAGRRVRTLLQGVQSAGVKTVSWDGRDDSGVQLAPGAYVLKLEAAGRREVRNVRLVH